jgi:hypothetical protein
LGEHGEGSHHTRGGGVLLRNHTTDDLSRFDIKKLEPERFRALLKIAEDLLSVLGVVVCRILFAVMPFVFEQGVEEEG